MINEINDQIMDTMFMAFRNLKHSMVSHAHPHLTPVQYEAIFFIKRNKQTAMGDIADFLQTTLPTVSSLIDKLIEEKYVTRKDDPKDRRVVQVTITKKGETFLEEALKHRKNVFDKILSFLTDEDKKQLLRIMQKVVEKSYEKNI